MFGILVLMVLFTSVFLSIYLSIYMIRFDTHSILLFLIHLSLPFYPILFYYHHHHPIITPYYNVPVLNIHWSKIWDMMAMLAYVVVLIVH